MPKKSNDGQNIISEIKRVEKSLKLDLKKSLGLDFRKELKKTERILRVEILRVEGKIEKTEEGLKEEIRKTKEEVKETKNDLMNKIDSFAGRTETLEEENTLGAHQARELKIQVDNHEARITKIEY